MRPSVGGDLQVAVAVAAVEAGGVSARGAGRPVRARWSGLPRLDDYASPAFPNLVRRSAGAGARMPAGSELTPRTQTRQHGEVVADVYDPAAARRAAQSKVRRGEVSPALSDDEDKLVMSPVLHPSSPDMDVADAASRVTAAKRVAKRLRARVALLVIERQLAQNTINSWLERHGRQVRADISPEEKRVITECFELLDADGSGALDADELEHLFETVRLDVDRQDIEKMMEDFAGVKHGAEIGYELFETMMSDFERSKQERVDTSDKTEAGAPREEPTESERNIRLLPFNDLVASFRRRKQLDDFIEGGMRRKMVVDNMELMRGLKSEDGTSTARESVSRGRLPQLSPRGRHAARHAPSPPPHGAKRLAAGGAIASPRFVLYGSGAKGGAAKSRISTIAAGVNVSPRARGPAPKWDVKLDIDAVMRDRADALVTSRRSVRDAPMYHVRAGAPSLPPAIVATPRFTTIEAVRAARRRVLRDGPRV